jgi:predicted KAP-like P-loop ATPase
MWRDSESDQDFLNFAEVADQVATLAIDHTMLPISIGVFGGWGSGKSTILKLVQNQLAAGDTAPTIVHFDAWLYQGFDDSRAALMEVISAELTRLAEEKRTLIDKAKSFAARINYFRGLGLIADFGIGIALGIPPGLLTTAGAALSSLASGGGTSKGEYDELKKDAGEVRHRLGELIKPAESRTPPQEIAAFRREFGELLTGLDTTLVVFIDNLDRCLPSAAIGTLEAIRLFLFMPRTAFVIAADEDMIRHSVARHFDDPNSAHVRDYLDKVIQVPLRVPQVGPDDVRAYMYSLFVSRDAPAQLGAVQQALLRALQQAWSGGTFSKEEVAKLAGSPAGLLGNLAIADRLAPILAAAPSVQGNPRIIKRLLNAVSLRQLLASRRGMNVDLATLAKLALFERCTDGPATLVLYRIVMEGSEAEIGLISPPKPKSSRELPPQWSAHSAFIEQWRKMEPLFEDAKALRPAVFLSRDVLAPAPTRAGLSEAASLAVEALLRVDSVNSPAGTKLVQSLGASDRRAVMSHLVASMREADWSVEVAGVHGAILLAKDSPDGAEEFRAFIAGLQTAQLHKPTAFLLRQFGYLAKS